MSYLYCSEIRRSQEIFYSVLSLGTSEGEQGGEIPPVHAINE